MDKTIEIETSEDIALIKGNICNECGAKIINHKCPNGHEEICPLCGELHALSLGECKKIITVNPDEWSYNI